MVLCLARKVYLNKSYCLLVDTILTFEIYKTVKMTVLPHWIDILYNSGNDSYGTFRQMNSYFSFHGEI